MNSALPVPAFSQLVSLQLRYTFKMLDLSLRRGVGTILGMREA